MLVRETSLGRSVKNDFEYFCDETLYILYEWHRDPLNPDDIPMGTWRIAKELDIEMRAAEDYCRVLAEKKLAEKLGEKRVKNEAGRPMASGLYRITPLGIKEVESNLTAYER